ncbi:hypothetical protein A3I56_02570 [Candidatus Roizmanbacteria bacterium RIFCSPLOWO2_02_FULL_43_10]|uniref:Uncharacterized protein n=1 Tax=Candidatus Roizmanbacteria bacterium RIFCSPLOWO2_02_FULL_43_10 TaxID=1802078 RepID=A0A1F7JSH8_9BACT|nr:MAG: hypothetical protein A3I56_02570 [Candidatus Roizmanbacteria bacterium RIFCSPLOWO2_02_FULL_43_10]
MWEACNTARQPLALWEALRVCIHRRRSRQPRGSPPKEAAMSYLDTSVFGQSLWLIATAYLFFSLIGLLGGELLYRAGSEKAGDLMQRYLGFPWYVLVVICEWALVVYNQFLWPMRAATFRNVFQFTPTPIYGRRVDWNKRNRERAEVVEVLNGLLEKVRMAFASQEYGRGMILSVAEYQKRLDADTRRVEECKRHLDRALAVANACHYSVSVNRKTWRMNLLV